MSRTSNTRILRRRHTVSTRETFPLGRLLDKPWRTTHQVSFFTRRSSTVYALLPVEPIASTYTFLASSSSAVNRPG